MIYTDAAYTQKDAKIGGWGFIAIYGDTVRTGGGYEIDAANNSYMELVAVLESLKWLKKTKHPVHVVTDSQYVLSVFENYKSWRSKGWRNSSGKVKHLETVQEFAELIDDMATYRFVDLSWVRGHVGHPMNEMADFIACTNKAIGFAIHQGTDIFTKGDPTRETFKPHKVAKHLLP